MNNNLRCPKCGSNQLSINQKGYSAGKALAGVVLTGGIGLLGGFIGSKKIIITCLNCNNKFSPEMATDDNSIEFQRQKKEKLNTYLLFAKLVHQKLETITDILVKCHLYETYVPVIKENLITAINEISNTKDKNEVFKCVELFMKTENSLSGIRNKYEISDLKYITKLTEQNTNKNGSFLNIIEEKKPNASGGIFLMIFLLIMSAIIFISEKQVWIILSLTLFVITLIVTINSYDKQKVKYNKYLHMKKQSEENKSINPEADNEGELNKFIDKINAEHPELQKMTNELNVLESNFTNKT